MTTPAPSTLARRNAAAEALAALSAGRDRRARTGRQRAWAYDAAATTDANANYYAAATDDAATTMVESSRPTLVKRARYEVRNNPHARGMVETFASDLIGHGPRLQITDDALGDVSEDVEDAFMEWAAICDVTGYDDFGGLLRLAVRELCQAGEVFLVQTTDPEVRGLDRSRVALRWAMIEPERVATPWGYFTDEDVIDGIRFDRATGRPVTYYIANSHPGDVRRWMNRGEEFNEVPAERVIHLFRRDTPGQVRGVPWLTPSLASFMHLRRFLLATITAAEHAAALSAIYTADADRTDDGVDSLADADEIPIEAGMFMTLPLKGQVTQLRSEHPNATYVDVKRENLSDAGRPLNMPANVILANSSEYNYASGRLDHQTYYKYMATVRQWLVRCMVDPMIRPWYRETTMLRRFDGLGDYGVRLPSHTWHWPGREHVDPLKEAMAEKTRLENGTLTFADVCAAAGHDWRRKIDQMAEIAEYMQDQDVQPAFVNAWLHGRPVPGVSGGSGGFGGSGGSGGSEDETDDANAADDEIEAELAEQEQEEARHGA
jgi:lambda family phage portal protein